MSLRSDVIRIINEYFSGSKKISELPAAGAISGAELVEIVQLGENVQTTVGAIVTGGAGVVAIVAGTNVTVDATDPQFPIVSSTGGSGDIEIGTTVITGGTTTRILYNNGGVVGEYPIGTGVATALAVNIGSAGAFVTFNGAGGTPSSITLTNATGLPLSTGVTGTLPVANGGTGAATLTGLLQGNGTSAFTAITNSSTVGQVLRVTGASTYAWGALDLADTDAVTGILPVANGGTGSATAVWWALTGTSTLTGNTTIANAGNTLTFSGTGVFTVSSTNTSTSPINFTSTYTVPAGVAVSSYGVTDSGTITGKGTANDLICIHRVNGALNNSAGTGIAHVSLRVDTTHGGSITPAISIAIQAIAGNSTSIAEVFRGVSSTGQTRQQLFGDGRFILTGTTTGSSFAGTMSGNAANGAGHIEISFQLASSATTAHTHYGLKATGGVTTNATNNTYNSFWDNRSLVVNNTGFVGYGFRYAPVVTGTQAGTEVLYAFIAESGNSGFQATSNTPTAVVQIGAVTTARASLRIEAGSTTTAPSSPNSGDIWHEGTGNRLMFRQGGTSIELIGTSSVNTVSATAPNRTLTVLINNTTYYIHAKTTND